MTRRAVNLTLNALAIILVGLTVGWLWGRVLWHVERANVAAPGTPVTWLPALTALPVLAIGIWAVIRALRTPDDKP
jgi:NhaP-type Na+/H+ or K+/H+ antiporter